MDESGAWRQKDTDRGLNLLTVLAEADHSVRRYTALRIPPDSSAGTLLFRVWTATGKQICSLPFTLAEIPSVAPVPAVPQAQCPKVWPALSPANHKDGGHPGGAN